MTDSGAARERYATLAAEARRAWHAADRVSRRLSAARLTAALATIAVAVWSLEAGAGWIARATMIVGVGVFLVLVRLHERVERDVRWHATRAALSDEAGWRVERAWDRLPPPVLPPADPHHPFAADLDVFGRASLFELIGPPGTAPGRERLARWLTEPADPGEVDIRQRAIQELARQGERRARVATHARLLAAVTTFDLGRFLEWSEGVPWLRSRPRLLWLVRGLTVATPLLLLLQILGDVSGAWWLATVAAGQLLSWLVQKPMALALGRSGAWERAVRAYRDLLGAIEQAPWTSTRLTDLQRQVTGNGHGASREIAAFERLVSLADLRHAPLLHFPVHALTLWDFHVWDALERWQRDSGRRVRRWVEVVGEVEALAALATLAADHPSWTFAEVDPRAVAFDAEALAHPLLPNETRVANDVSVGPPGRVVCITGSNMSGKSTLLRAIGVNAVLALAGGPACATRLRLAPVALYTSLRISDSLEEGVSYFMAALARLRSIVEAASAASAAGAPAPIVLYLLDEVLQGTNTVEREVAVRLIVRHLVSSRAIGAITTHDLGLTNTPELREHADHVHFSETVGTGPGGALSFDYRLRPGIATSRNALRLMELVGLIKPEEIARLPDAHPPR